MPAPQWIGYWEQAVFGREPMRDLELEFRDGEIEGRGTDVVGAFIFCGKYDSSGAVTLVKQYIGRHQVLYHGWYDGEGSLTGEWSLGGERGPFQMRLTRSGNGDIQTLS